MQQVCSSISTRKAELVKAYLVPEEKALYPHKLGQFRHSICESGASGNVGMATSIVRQLEAINHKPSKGEITDKLLMGLHSSFSAVRTTLALRSPEPSIKDIITALKQFEDNELSTSGSAHFDLDPYIKTETTLYAGCMRGSGGEGGGYRAGGDDGFDCGNTKRKDGGYGYLLTINILTDVLMQQPETSLGKRRERTEV
ncbi:hypothetical protein FIBSPDRAFT_889113 [Athelia psychrophila]|uniref:Uncharacterized protein n=1 Tax=Athelia psychrophila TaxID=1759441 RepID=A0A166MNS6_9AGAM|nr:hypothetical protein FIBSPDRAFT_889113 [Fibularhizoctonia sp. CBS 109695]